MTSATGESKQVNAETNSERLRAREYLVQLPCEHRESAEVAEIA